MAQAIRLIAHYRSRVRPIIDELDPGTNPDEGGETDARIQAVKAMRAFDDFTFMIAGGDVERVQVLERGPMRVYWKVAEHHLTQLLSEKKRQDRANKKTRYGR